MVYSVVQSSVKENFSELYPSSLIVSLCLLQFSFLTSLAFLIFCFHFGLQHFWDRASLELSTLLLSLLSAEITGIHHHAQCLYFLFKSIFCLKNIFHFKYH